jgi:hypothetical protein
MNIIEVIALPNGAHRNQNGFAGDLPEGWAIIPDDMVIPDSFPFVGVEAEETPYYDEEGEVQYTALTVTTLTPGVMPDPAPVDDPEPTTEEILNAMLGVE